MKTIKFLVQTLLVAIPLAFVSCSSDNDDFKIPTPQNSDVLLSAYKKTYNTAGDYEGFRFVYDDNNNLKEAYHYNVAILTNDTSYYTKYEFGNKIGNEMIVTRYYPTSTPGASTVTWADASNPSLLVYNNKNKIVKTEKYGGFVDIEYAWDGDKLIRTNVDGMPNMNDTIKYNRGNYIDKAAYNSKGSNWDIRSEETTSFSTYANYFQMIPVELFAVHHGLPFSTSAYFSDNAVSKFSDYSKQEYYTDDTKANLRTTYEYSSTTDYALTFGSMSKRVPEKVVVTRTSLNKTINHTTDPETVTENPYTYKDTYTFTYIKKK